MIPLPNKKYSIIYADPPWQYKRNGNHSAESQYNVMSLEDIKALKVNNLAEDNSHLYLWVTNCIKSSYFTVIVLADLLQIVGELSQ